MAAPNDTGIASRALAEAIGTFMLVFAGTGAIAVDSVSGGAVGHVGISLTFGLIVMAVIYALGDVSGAHINPAVTLGFAVARRMRPRTAAIYVVAQLIGAVLASVLVRTVLSPTELGQTLPAGAAWQSFAVEVVLTWMLMFVILRVATGSRESGIMAGAAIGAVVALEALFAGPITGASMNPARSFGPALVAGTFDSLWIYLAAPPLGAMLAVWTCRAMCLPDCCAPDDDRCAD